MAHVHAELMKQYAEDAAETDKPWERWQCKHNEWYGWRTLDNHPEWAQRWSYRRKPRTININGHEVPMPCKTKESTCRVAVCFKSEEDANAFQRAIEEVFRQEEK